MATMIVKHRVANFESWKQVFDSMEGTRREHGWLGHSVHREAADPNMVVIVNRVRDAEGAKRYGASSELRAAMQRAGVQGAPEIAFLEDAEEKRY
jgi:quinol monooxygenase YgiN